MDDRKNTIAGWVLFGGIAALGLSIATGMYFEPERPEKMGYVVEGVEAESAGGAAVEAEKPVAFYLQTASAARGEAQFKKCAACHTITPGGPNAIGPNLYGIFGKPHGHLANFQYSDALKKVPGTWDWDGLFHWLHSPKAFAPGTKMSFAGISKPQDRADVLLYLNSQGNNLPIPAAPAETAAAPAAAGAAATNKAAPAGGSETAATQAGAPQGATAKQAATKNN